ncbi:MAG: hypothetical protein R3B45_09685 [Bdellovibrionota bacterium]
MIKINLAPIDEIESPYWYIPEVAMFVLCLALSWFAAQYYLDGIKDNIANFEREIAEKNEAFRTISKATARYAALDKDIEKLNEKLNALQKITISKIARFLPIILLEHVQNLKPEGIWFNYISDDSEKNILTIVAKSFDSLLVAEFMSALDSTKLQEVDPSDLRTQVYFDQTKLERISTIGFSTVSSGNRANLSKEEPKITLLQGEGNTGGYWSAGDAFFPELQEYPAFQLTLSYKDRKAINNKPIALAN